MTLLDSHPESPYRPVDWRWRLACGMLDGPVPRRGRRPDPWVERAVRLRRRQAAREGEGPGPGPRRGDRSAFRACQIWHGEDPRQRRELEARVLAGQPAGEIADRLKIPTDVVVSYEKIYFAVRDRLGAPGYIGSVVLGHDPLDGPHADHDDILRRYAYWGGPHVLEALLDLGDAAWTASAATGGGPLAGSIRMALLARSIPVTERTALGLIRLSARLREVEREAAADTAYAGPVRATVGPFPELPSGEKDPCPAKLAAVAVARALIAGPEGGKPWERSEVVTLGHIVAAPLQIESSARRTA